VNIEDFAPIPEDQLRAMRWRGQRSYRVLSHSFSVRWNGGLTGDRIDYVWGGFAVPVHEGGNAPSARRNGHARYSLIDLGPGYARRFRLLIGDQQLISSPREEDVLAHLLWQIFQRMHQESHEFLLVHAGSIVTPRGEAVLLPAGSGFGKTTLVAGLVKAGYGFLSDEVGVIDHKQRVVRPYPRAMNFKQRLPDLFSDGLLRGQKVLSSVDDVHVRAEEIRPAAMAEPSPVRFVIAPRYEEGVPTTLTALSRAATVEVLWRNAVNADHFGPRAIPILAEVARGAAGFRLVSGDLREALEAIDEITGRSEPGIMSDPSG
jgi:hypothetical protein